MKYFIFVYLIVFTTCLYSIELQKNFIADFNQTMTNENNRLIFYKGTLEYEKNSFIRWTYDKPDKRKICIYKYDFFYMEIDYNLEQVKWGYNGTFTTFSEVLKKAIYNNEKKCYLAHFNENTYCITTNKDNLPEEIKHDNGLEEIVTGGGGSGLDF